VINVDGTGKKSVIPKLLDPQGIDLDTKNQKIYDTEHHGQRVGVVDYDGSNQKVLHSFSGEQVYPSDIVVDATNGFLFVQVETVLSTGGQLVRMGLDGSNPTAIVKDITRAYGIAVDPSTKVAYYVSGGHGGFISNVSYDGSSTSVLLGGLEWPFEIDIDRDSQRLVFSTTGVGDGKIQTMKLDGTDIQDVQELGFAPMGVNFGKIPFKQSVAEVTPLNELVGDTSVYCMNDSSKNPPYYCHAPPLPSSCKTDKDCVTPWYNSFCMNDATKHAPYQCKQELPPTCKTDKDCQR
jgi:DNA-binding beta-propeller fold protein YncE